MSYKEFPSNSDYTIIVQNLNAFISNKNIIDGKPQYSKNKRLISYAGGYSKVFPVQINNSKKAFRFWTANIEDSQKRYQEIDKYLKEKNLPYFVDFNYHHNELTWEEEVYPFVSMDWVEGLTLNKYLDENINNSTKVLELSDYFLEMVEALHRNNIAHGDLQDGNILVLDDGHNISLKLIDYDSIYVPALKNFSMDIIGVESYQHPKKNDTKYLSEKIDYFSELVIYLSLLAYAEDSTLWIKGQDQKLLFDAKDFKDTKKSTIFNTLRTSGLSSVVIDLTQILDGFCSKNSLDELFPLEDSIRDKFKELSNMFSKIRPGKSVSSRQIIDHDKIDNDLENMIKKFSNIKSKVNIDTEEIDNKIIKVIKKMK